MSAYIVSMSPVKMSKNNNPYLKGKLQSGKDQYQDFVVYNIGQKSHLEDRQ